MDFGPTSLVQMSRARGTLERCLVEKIKVLLADDHPVVRSGIRELLNRAPDIQVVGEAGGGREALALVADEEADLLILDMNMPDLSGIEVVKILAEQETGIRILALSAYDSIAYITGSLEHGAFGYLTKEEVPESIVEAVRGVARGEKNWLSPGITEKIKAYQARQAEFAQHPLHTLSEREKEVLGLIGQGYDNPAIGDLLFISLGTVKNHATNVYTKLGLHSRAEAVAWAWENGLVKRDEPAE